MIYFWWAIFCSLISAAAWYELSTSPREPAVAKALIAGAWFYLAGVSLGKIAIILVSMKVS